MQTVEMRRIFEREFGRPAGALLLARAPGRVNLIGEHTDYNGGFVLPMAIDRSIALLFEPVAEDAVDLFSADFGDGASFRLDGAPDRLRAQKRPGGTWINYPMGVAWSLAEAGHALRGLRGVVAGDVPIGAGLSSSAAFEVAAAKAFCAASGARPDGVALARICQRAENEFVGMRCGIMDQFVSLFAEEGCALLIDCLTLDRRTVRLPDGGLAVLVCNTGVKHELVASEYNRRRAECEEALRRLSAADPRIRTWRDATADDVQRRAGALGEVLARRARHVVTENARVLEAVGAMERGDAERLGALLDASHESLRDDFEVSCRELDIMADLGRAEEGALGARMVGGGFGGCTITLVRTEAVERVRRRVAEGYRRATGRTAETYVFAPARGASLEGCDD